MEFARDEVPWVFVFLFEKMSLALFLYCSFMPLTVSVLLQLVGQWITIWVSLFRWFSYCASWIWIWYLFSLTLPNFFLECILFIVLKLRACALRVVIWAFTWFFKVRWCFIAYYIRFILLFSSPILPFLHLGKTALLRGPKWLVRRTTELARTGFLRISHFQRMCLLLLNLSV